MIDDIAGVLADRGVGLVNGLIQWQCGCSVELMPRPPRAVRELGTDIPTGWIYYACDEHKSVAKIPPESQDDALSIKMQIATAKALRAGDIIDLRRGEDLFEDSARVLSVRPDAFGLNSDYALVTLQIFGPLKDELTSGLAPGPLGFRISPRTEAFRVGANGESE